MTDKELLKKALHRIEYHYEGDPDDKEAAEAIKARLAQPEPKIINMEAFVGSGNPVVPVCWMNANDIDKTDWKVWAHGKPTVSMPLFASPPKKELVGLTDEEYEAMAEQYVTNCYFDTLKYAHAIEKSLREKNQ